MNDTAKAPEISKRPQCPNCGKRLRPRMDWGSERVDPPGGGFEIKRTNYHWTGRYEGYGAFCTLRCCEEFANEAYRAGYRHG